MLDEPEARIRELLDRVVALEAQSLGIMAMKWVYVFVIAAVFVSSAAIGSEEVILSSNLASESISQELASGDLVSVNLYLESSDASALFGGELELGLASNDVSIRSVTFHPAFSAGLASGDASSNGTVEATRVQSLGSINRNLGADGAPVVFATVELEVLSDGPFESALIVKARGALVGKIPQSTIVLGNRSGEDGWGEGRIVIIGTQARRDEGTEGAQAAGEQGTGNGEQLTWAVEQATASLEVRPVGGSEAVTVLEPDTEYEIHYAAGESVNGFDLFVTADSPDAAVDVSLCWEGATVMGLPAPDGSQDAVREVISADVPSRNAEVGSRNLICNFVTGAAGTLALDLHLYDIDPAERQTVEMVTYAEFTVE